jgi:histone-lysine N-methyltransferase SETMAR
MLTLFWDHQGPLVEHYMSNGTTATSATYCDLLRNHLKPAIRSQLCGLLSTGVLLQHDNARPHTACVRAATIEDTRFECLPHPLNSPDLAPSDYHIFGPLKEVISGKTFHSDEEVQEAVQQWQHTRPKNFFQEESRH